MALRRNFLIAGDIVGNTTFVRAYILQQKATNGLPWKIGGTTQLVTDPTVFPDVYSTTSGTNPIYFSDVETLVQRDGGQFDYDTIVVIGGHWDAYNLFALAAPTLTTTRARATALLDRIRTQQPAARVFWCNCLPHTTAGVNTAITNQNVAIEGDIAIRSDAAYITQVDINAAYAANATYATDYGLFNSVNAYGAKVIADTIVNAMTAAGY